MPSPTPVRRAPLQARSNETVRTILSGASALLEKVPIDQITTSRIAEQAEVSVGALYRFYKDKQEIYDAIAVDALEEFQQELQPLVSAKKLLFSRKKPIDVVLDAYISFLDRRPDFRVLALGRHISERTREEQTDPDTGPAALLQSMLVRMFRLKPGPRLKLRLKIAAETGDRLIAYAYAQATLAERDAVLAELKLMLGRYLLR